MTLNRRIESGNQIINLLDGLVKQELKRYESNNTVHDGAIIDGLRRLMNYERSTLQWITDAVERLNDLDKERDHYLNVLKDNGVER